MNVNPEAHTDGISISEFNSFDECGHWICGHDGWEEVGVYISEWLTANTVNQFHTSSENL